MSLVKFFGALAISAIVLIWISSYFISSKNNSAPTHDYVGERVIKQAQNKAKADSLEDRAIVQDSLIAHYEHVIDSLQNGEKAIVNSYKPLYDEINNAADSDQYNLTLQLLAKHHAKDAEGR